MPGNCCSSLLLSLFCMCITVSAFYVWHDAAQCNDYATPMPCCCCLHLPGACITVSKHCKCYDAQMCIAQIVHALMHNSAKPVCSFVRCPWPYPATPVHAVIEPFQFCIIGQQSAYAILWLVDTLIALHTQCVLDVP